MAETEVDRWREAVMTAAIAQDGDELARLYNEGRSLFGDQLGSEWARALSAFDATAITG